LAERKLLNAIKGVAADIHGENHFALKVENRAQITFNHDGINCFAVVSRQALNLMCAQSRVERIRFENFEGGLCRSLLFFRQFGETFPERM
jgi:hypothetical protein